MSTCMLHNHPTNLKGKFHLLYYFWNLLWNLISEYFPRMSGCWPVSPDVCGWSVLWKCEDMCLVRHRKLCFNKSILTFCHSMVETRTHRYYDILSCMQPQSYKYRSTVENDIKIAVDCSRLRPLPPVLQSNTWSSESTDESSLKLIFSCCGVSHASSHHTSDLSSSNSIINLIYW